MAKFIVKGFVKYCGKKYENGSIVEVKSEDVEEFKRFGWQIVDKKQAKDSDKAGKGDGQGAGQNAGQGEGQGEDLSKLTNAQLEALLEQKGIEFKKGSKKADLLALLA